MAINISAPAKKVWSKPEFVILASAINTGTKNTAHESTIVPLGTIGGRKFGQVQNGPAAFQTFFTDFLVS